MVQIQKTKDGWLVNGQTEIDLLIGMRAIERMSVKAVPEASKMTTQPCVTTAKLDKPKKSKKVRKQNYYPPRQNKGMTRLETIREFLLKNGPARSRDIVKQTGLPHGTCSTLLNRKNFTPIGDGRWSYSSPETNGQAVSQPSETTADAIAS